MDTGNIIITIIIGILLLYSIIGCIVSGIRCYRLHKKIEASIRFAISLAAVVFGIIYLPSFWNGNLDKSGFNMYAGLILLVLLDILIIWQFINKIVKASKENRVSAIFSAIMMSLFLIWQIWLICRY